jgi:hypothetical protein
MRLSCAFELRSEYVFDCDRARVAYDVRMGQIRGVCVALLATLAACGGGEESKTPPTDQIAQSDASAEAATTDTASDAGVTSAQTDATTAQAADAAPADDVDKSVGVCGDETVPIEKVVRAQVKACWNAAATKNPSIDGHVRVNFVIDARGKVTKVDFVQQKTLPAETSACILKAISDHKLDGSKCAGKTVGFEEAFGRAAKP